MLEKQNEQLRSQTAIASAAPHLLLLSPPPPPAAPPPAGACSPLAPRKPGRRHRLGGPGAGAGLGCGGGGGGSGGSSPLSRGPTACPARRLPALQPGAAPEAPFVYSSLRRAFRRGRRRRRPSGARGAGTPPGLPLCPPRRPPRCWTRWSRWTWRAWPLGDEDDYTWYWPSSLRPPGRARAGRRRGPQPSSVDGVTWLMLSWAVSRGC